MTQRTPIGDVRRQAMYAEGDLRRQAMYAEGVK